MNDMSNPTEAQQRFAERERRNAAVVALQEPDCVPIAFSSNFWHARRAGITNKTAMYDYEALADATRKVVLELQPDSVNSPFGGTALGPTLEILGYKGYEWPGHGLPDDRPFQYIDREYMKGDEYDDFIEDPSWFYFTRYLPRVCEAYEPLARMPQLAGRTSVRIPFFSRYFGEPAIETAMATIAKAGREANKMLDRSAVFDRELKELGFPLSRHASTTAPYDSFGDFLRGSKGIMLDMFRRKDKLLAAMEKVVPMLVRDATEVARVNGGPIVFIPLHWGVEGFMSVEQFKLFYWPPLKKVMMGLIDNGLVPLIFWEGKCDSRLEVIADIPKGKCIYYFEGSDLFKAKAVLGDVVCLRGGVPATMLIAGTPTEIREHCRKLIKIVGKGGGFMLDASSGIPEEAKTENVLAMFQATRELGRY